MIDKQRAAFEVMESKRKGFASDTLTRATFEPDDEYLLPLVQARWEAYQAALASPEVQELRKDAERYQWLRQQHWSDSEMCIVCRPKETVRLGGYCPSLALLDSHIDAAMEEQK